MSFFIYGNAGGIDEVIKELANPNKKTFKSLESVFKHLIKKNHDAFTMEDLSVRFYGYDERINKNVYMISTSNYEYMSTRIIGFKMFINYLVEIKEEE